MLSKAEQTILGVLLWHANSKGKKNFSTWTHMGFGSGKTELGPEADPGEVGELDVPLFNGYCSSGKKSWNQWYRF